MRDDYPLYVHWVKTLDWLLDMSERIPKLARFTLASRISNLALDILEGVIEAIYRRDRGSTLDGINLKLEKLRALIRICHQRQYLSIRQYEYISQQIETAGSMIGGWRKQHETK